MAKLRCTRRQQNAPGTAIDNLVLTPNCRQCPIGTSVYAFSASASGGNAYNISSAPFAPACRPFFGTLPVLINGPYGLPIYSTSNFAWPTAENIVYPTTGTLLFDKTFCPVNHYNRECAETKLFAMQLNSAHTPACTPCSSIGSGWHTGGATGAWFCMPPAGTVFALRSAAFAAV